MSPDSKSPVTVHSSDIEALHGGTTVLQRRGRTAIVMLAAVIGLLSLVTSDGLYNIDEFIIAASVEALHSYGSLAYENGYAAFPADNLKLAFFISGPHGLVPQYPIGATLLGASLAGVMGIRGLILINALSAIATLLLTRQLARHLFENENIALLSVVLLVVCTFFLEFAFGIWPHMVSAMFVTCGLYLAIKSLDAPRRDAIKWSLLSGLAVGAGLLVRVDTLLILLPVGASIFLFSRHAMASLLAGAMGLIPGFLAMAFANQYKFGSWNPLSYGRSGGLANLSNYTTEIAVICAAALILLFARRIPWRRIPPTFLGVASFLAIAVALTIPGVREYASQYMSGFWDLLVDAGSIQDPRHGVATNADGVVYFWGTAKKALGQSMPWMGVLLIWAIMLGDARNRRTLAIFLLIITLWSFPFILYAWHGGFGSNMRYFFPLLPFLCVMSAAAWLRLLSINGEKSAVMVAGLLAGVAALLLWTWLGPSGIDGAGQIMSTYVLLATCAACLMTVLLKKRRKSVAPIAQFLVAAGFSISAILGYQDLSASQSHRNWTARISDSLSAIPAPSLVFGPAELLAFQISRPDGLIALPGNPAGHPRNFNLITSAINAGYGVYALPDFAAAVVQANPTLALGPRAFDFPGGQMHEISLQQTPESHPKPALNKESL